MSVSSFLFQSSPDSTSKCNKRIKAFRDLVEVSILTRLYIQVQPLFCKAHIMGSEVSILTRLYIQVQRDALNAQYYQQKGFNPHQTLHPSATSETPTMCNRDMVSILTRLYIQVQLHHWQCCHYHRRVSILTRLYIQVQRYTCSQNGMSDACFNPHQTLHPSATTIVSHNEDDRRVSILTRLYIQVQPRRAATKSRQNESFNPHQTLHPSATKEATYASINKVFQSSPDSTSKCNPMMSH